MVYGLHAAPAVRALLLRLLHARAVREEDEGEATEMQSSEQEAAPSLAPVTICA